MNKSSITQALIRNTNKLTEWGNRNLPRLLEGAGVIFFGLTIYKAVEKAPNVKPALKEAEEKKGEPLTFIEKAKTVANEVKEPAFYAVVSLGCFHGSVNVMHDRLATALAVAGIKQSHADNYILAAKEMMGNSKSEKAEDQALEAQLDSMLSGNIPVIDTETGTDRIAIPSMNLAFVGDARYLRQALKEISERLWRTQDPKNGEVTWNEFADLLQEKYGFRRFEYATIGDNIGWNFGEVYEICRRPQPEYDECPETFRIPYREVTTMKDGHAWIVIGILPVVLREWGCLDFYREV